MKVAIILTMAVAISGHGFMTIPPARQLRCNYDGGFWWPTDGSAIPDAACRSAYQYVAARSGESAAQYMFTQINEYAALAGPDYSLSAIKDHVVGTSLCSANATGLTNFGDKSGMSLPLDWQTTRIPSSRFEVEICATATHNPSIFRLYVTDHSFNAETDDLTWDRLSLIGEFNNPQPVDAVSILCTSPSAYRLPITVPYRRRGIIYMWWQRQDQAGEGFYNCADFTMDLARDDDL